MKVVSRLPQFNLFLKPSTVMVGMVLFAQGCVSPVTPAKSIVMPPSSSRSSILGAPTAPLGTSSPTSNSTGMGLKADQLGLLVNDDDPNSVATAEYYISKRGIPPANVVHLHLPVQAQISRTQFSPIKAQVDAALPSSVQALAIAWTIPSRVECNSMTSAFARGFIAGPCDSGTCNLASTSPYYDSNSRQPFTDFGMRPAMMLAGLTLADVKALIDRGVASDGTHPTGMAHIMKTSDAIRNLRARYYDPAKLGTAISPSVYVDILSADSISGTTDTLFYFQGLASVSNIKTNTFPPGAVADHLTSYGGMLTDSAQMSCLQFIAGGATGTFGTVSEPCAYSQKFPDPAIMISHYTQGETLIEAYWKSISQTFQGEFVGEPLASPWRH